MPDKKDERIPLPTDADYFDIEGDKDNELWRSFKTTREVEPDKKIIEQIVGQENCLEDLDLNFQKFLRKVERQRQDFESFWHRTKQLVVNWNYEYNSGGKKEDKKNRRWWNKLSLAEKIFQAQKKIKDMAKADPQSNADRDRLNNVGVYCLLIGPPGTGKSLIAKGYRERLEAAKIQPTDIMLLPNPLDENRPRHIVVPGGFGKKLLEEAEISKKTKGHLRKKLFTALAIFGIVLGIAMVIFGMMLLIEGVLFFGFIITAMGLGVMFTVPMSIYFFRNIIGSSSGEDDPPVIFIDSSDGKPKFIDASGQSGAAFLGDIKWDALQTRAAGGEPPHTRVKAGAIHRAHWGVLFYDEMAQIAEEDIPDFLTVLEEGQYAVTSRSKGRMGTSALNVATEPLPCTFFFLGCGNEDMLQRLHPALRQRFKGYGSDIFMDGATNNNGHMRRRVVKFIVNETDRLGLLPFTRQACLEVVEECRRRATFKDKITVQLRPMLAVLSKASEWARKCKRSVVNVDDVKWGIGKAISAEMQYLKQTAEIRNLYKHVFVQGTLQGVVNGLAVQTTSAGEEIGSVLPIRVMAFKVRDKSGTVKYSGQLQAMAKESLDKVMTIVFHKFGMNPKDWLIHCSFEQIHGVDGPSAGAAMTVAMYSIFMDKKIKQDVALTGEVLLSQTGEISIAPIGGVVSKIRGAEMFGIKTVLIPYENYVACINETDFQKTKVIGVKTLEEVLEIMLVDEDVEAQRCKI